MAYNGQSLRNNENCDVRCCGNLVVPISYISCPRCHERDTHWHSALWRCIWRDTKRRRQRLPLATSAAYRPQSSTSMMKTSRAPTILGQLNPLAMHSFRHLALYSCPWSLAFGNTFDNTFDNAFHFAGVFDWRRSSQARK